MLNPEPGIKEAIDSWISHGLHPGSFTYYLLKGDYEEALKHAHPLLKPHIQDQIDYVETLPIECRGENMESWKGENDKDNIFGCGRSS